MNDVPLRDRIARLDPVASGVSIEPPTTPSSQARLESIMNTSTLKRPTKTARFRTPGRSTPEESNREQSNPVRSRPAWWVPAAAALALLAGITGVIAFTGGDDDAPVAAPLQLTVGEGDALASCLAVDAATMSTMSPAFAATATSVEGERVILDVDRWYAGGDASTVELHAAAGMESLIAGFDFEVGGQYLITASEGTVNFCGYSGPATPELSAVFDQAFPAS